MPNKPLTSYDLMGLLRKKYSSKWYFIGKEVGCGATGFDGGQGKGRLDAWAMRPAWSQPLYLGFEIKVSRQDYLRDDKWQQYLGACNQFYFVTPPGLIGKDEIPADAGLLESSANAKMLRTVKKAPHSGVDYAQLFNVLKARLMSDFYDAYSPYSKDSDEEKLVKMEADEWNKVVGDKIAAQIAYKEDLLKRREEEVEKMEASMEEMRRFAGKLGIHPSRWSKPTEADCRRAWLRVNGALAPPEIGRMATELEQLARRAEVLAHKMTEFKRDAEASALEGLDGDST